MQKLLICLVLALIMCTYLGYNGIAEGFCGCAGSKTIYRTNPNQPWHEQHPFDPNLIYPEAQRGNQDGHRNSDPVVINKKGTHGMLAKNLTIDDGTDNWTTRPIFNLKNRFHRIGLLYPLSHPHKGLPLFAEKMFANAPKGKQAYVYYYYDMQNRVYKQINLPPVLRNGDKVLLPESEGEPYGVMVYENDLPADQSIF